MTKFDEYSILFFGFLSVGLAVTGIVYMLITL